VRVFASRNCKLVTTDLTMLNASSHHGDECVIELNFMSVTAWYIALDYMRTICLCVEFMFVYKSEHCLVLDNQALRTRVLISFNEPCRDSKQRLWIWLLASSRCDYVWVRVPRKSDCGEWFLQRWVTGSRKEGYCSIFCGRVALK
jgi:hypothetical protein